MNKERLAFFLSATLVLGISSNDVYLSSLPNMAESFGVDYSLVNLTLSLFNVGMAIGCLLIGFVSDYYGRRMVYIYALCGYMISAILIAFTPWLMVIILWRFFQGAFVSVFAVVSLQIIVDVCDGRDRVNYIGLIAMCAVVSPAVAPVVGAYVAHYSSWQMCFVVSALFALILLVIAQRSLNETIQERIDLPKLRLLLEEYRAYFCSRQFMWFSLMVTFFYGAYFTFICMSSYIYVDELGCDPRWYAKIFFLLALSYMLGNSIMRHLNSKGISKQGIVGYGLTLSTVGVAISFLVYTTKQQWELVAILTAGMAVMRAGYALLSPPAQIIAMEAGRWREGTAVGLIYFMQFVFGAIVIAIVSILPWTPLLNAVWAIATLLLFAIVAFFIGCIGKGE